MHSAEAGTAVGGRCKKISITGAELSAEYY